MKIIDIHTHLWLGSADNDRAGILKAAEAYGYERVYVSTLGGGSNPTPEQVDACNETSARFIADYPELVRGWVYVNPRHDNKLDVIKRGIEDRRMTGVKLWIATLCDDPLVYPVAEYCIDHKLPVLIHALDKTVGQGEFESVGMNVRNLALRYPELKIVMAHLGGNEYTGIRAIRGCPNVTVDISGVFCRADTLKYAIERIGVDRLMYGTDLSGNMPFWNYIGRVNELKISPADKEKIFRLNAINFGL